MGVRTPFTRPLRWDKVLILSGSEILFSVLEITPLIWVAALLSLTGFVVVVGGIEDRMRDVERKVRVVFRSEWGKERSMFR